jgi:hypothetical protein
LEEVGSAEMTEWIAFAGVEPFGGEVEDMRAGLMPAMTVNMNKDKDTDPVHPMDFFPWHERIEAPEPEPLTESPEELAARIRREIFKAPG